MALICQPSTPVERLRWTTSVTQSLWTFCADKSWSMWLFPLSLFIADLLCILSSFLALNMCYRSAIVSLLVVYCKTTVLQCLVHCHWLEKMLQRCIPLSLTCIAVHLRTTHFVLTVWCAAVCNACAVQA